MPTAVAAAAPVASTTPASTPAARTNRVTVYVHRPERTPGPAGSRAAQCRRACSGRWRDDLRLNLDRDYLGRLTGPGTKKVRCAGCELDVPPQDVTFDPEVRGPCCTDCRTKAPPERVPKSVVTAGPLSGVPAGPLPAVPVLGLPGVVRFPLERRVPVRPAVSLGRVGYGPSATYEPTVEPAADGSALNAALAGMVSAGVRLRDDALPAGGSAVPDADADPVEVAEHKADEQRLAEAMAIYTRAAADPDPAVRAGAWAAWREASGEKSAEADQEWRASQRRVQGDA
jgi:hypothetical protein